MVGIVIVSHSQKLAEGVKELAALMAPTVPIRAAGGMDDGGFGTDYAKIYEAIDSIYSDDGVILLMDLGSAVMTTEMVLEEMSDRNIQMVDCPIVEGAISAAVASEGNLSIQEVINAAKTSKNVNKF